MANNEHLTTEEILEFITLDKITPETLAFAGRVNGHIGECKECFDKVVAFQTVQDGFEQSIREAYESAAKAVEEKAEAYMEY